MRTIKLVNANIGKRATIETSAETWGELKAEEEVQEFLTGSNTIGVIQQSQNSLELDTAELPGKLTDEGEEFDFAIFFITKKSKAGVQDDYDNWSFAQLRAEAASRDSVQPDTPGNYGGRDDIIEKLRADDSCSVGEGDQSSGVACDSDFQELVVSTLQRIEAKVDSLSGYGDLGDSVAQEAEEEGLSEEEQQFAQTLGNQL